MSRYTKHSQKLEDPEAVLTCQAILLWVIEQGFSVRSFETKYKIPRTTLHNWLIGTFLPGPRGFQKLYKAAHAMGCPHAADATRFDYLFEEMRR